MSNPTEGRTFDLLPNIHCAPEICGACRRWLVETYTREVEAARQQGAREAWREAGAELRRWAIGKKHSTLRILEGGAEEFERRAGS